jgi:endo-1,4-beta-xylanase
MLSIYGWSLSPAVEYYIMEDPIGYQPAGTLMGTLMSDGSTYAIWKSQQTNTPPIENGNTALQYFSIRQKPRVSGTVTVANHFNAWAAHGMKLGTLSYQILAVESLNGTGSGSFSVAKDY